MKHFPQFLALCNLLCTPSTSAAIIYSGLQNIPIATTFDGVYVDVENLDNSTNHGSSTITVPLWDVNLFFGGVGEYNESNFQPVRASSGDSFSAIQNLSYGTLVSAASTFASGVGGSGDVGSEHVGFDAGQFQPGADGYIGFRLNGGHYGWMRVSLSFNDAGAVIKDWAYDNTGAAMTVGAVPEPSGALLVVVGALGMISIRRRESR